MQISNEDKNYYRILLKDVSDCGLEKPIILAGKYQYDTRYEYATFTNIRILLRPPYSKTKIICNHLNVLKTDISRFYSLNEINNKKKFYFVGYPVEYQTDGNIRYGFKLSGKVTFPSFGELSERTALQDKIDRECADLNDWVQNNITESNIGLLRKRKE